ncbi:hypothetical protein [Tunturiibacter gelidiferens]|uniref:hypothetical protein n=1 Tax=Tunturiibacter gelidiferens TaxID=3069689 RepID=UPI003D9B055F
MSVPVGCGCTDGCFCTFAGATFVPAAGALLGAGAGCCRLYDVPEVEPPLWFVPFCAAVLAAPIPAPIRLSTPIHPTRLIMELLRGSQASTL